MTSVRPANLVGRGFLFASMLVLTALVAAAPASASDTFRFVNETGKVFTPNNQDGFEEGCWYGATGPFVPGPVGAEEGSVQAEAGISCGSEWGSNLAFDQTYGGSWEQRGETVYSWAGGIGAFGFDASDPLIGWSSVSCASLGAAWEESNDLTPIEGYMTSEADGDTCTVKWLPGVSAGDVSLLAATALPAAGHIRMVDSLALVRGGKARVRVEVFGVGHARRRAEVVLRTRSGTLIARGSRMLRVGARVARIAVPLPRSIRRALANRTEMRVHAAARFDNPDSSGDTTARLILSRRR